MHDKHECSVLNCHMFQGTVQTENISEETLIVTTSTQTRVVVSSVFQLHVCAVVYPDYSGVKRECSQICSNENFIMRHKSSSCSLCLVTSTDHMVTSSDHVVTSTDHVVTSTDHILTSTDHVVTSTDHTAMFAGLLACICTAA